VKFERNWTNAEPVNKLRKKAQGWAAEPTRPRPYGPRPYEIKQAQALASAIVTGTLRLSDSQRLRDFRAHILERRVESGAAFQNGHSSRSEFARGILWAELEAIDCYRRYDQLRWSFDIPAKTPDDQAAAFAGYEIQEIKTRRSFKYGRPGRKPNGDRAMTAAQRVSNYRARKKSV
jgi:hypothetical protein